MSQKQLETKKEMMYLFATIARKVRSGYLDDERLKRLRKSLWGERTKTIRKLIRDKNLTSETVVKTSAVKKRVNNMLSLLSDTRSKSDIIQDNLQNWRGRLSYDSILYCLQYADGEKYDSGFISCDMIDKVREILQNVILRYKTIPKENIQLLSSYLSDDDIINHDWNDEVKEVLLSLRGYSKLGSLQTEYKKEENLVYCS